VTSPLPAIAADDLTLRLGSGDSAVEVLRGVGLTVPQGQTLALLGPSGSGKSSLMAVLSGLERTTAGSLTVAGEDFAALSEDQLAAARRGRIGIVMTPLELAGVTDARARAEAELEAVGLGHRLNHYPAQLSGGEQQRVAIARALAPRPPLVFADEPTGNLDAATGTGIMDLLFARRAEAGATLVIITHDAALAQRCERVITLGDGRIVSDSANHSVPA
jgi:putative ABC transport system ATP-binding protein